MLQFIRRNTQSVFIQAIVVIIILAFVLWGGKSMMNSRQSAIQVNKEEISFQDFDTAYKQTYNRVAAQFGGEVPKGLVDSLNLKQQVINQLVRDSLLRQGADKMGIVVSAGEIQDEIQSMVQFHDNNGFNLEKYMTLLSSNRLSPAKFEKSMKRDLLAQKTISDLQNFVAPPTDFEINELYMIENETVSVNYVAVSPKLFNDSVQATEAELSEYFEQHQDNYKTAPQYKLDYITFNYDALGEKVTIDDAAVEQYYNDNLSSYQTPERRHARHILFRVTDTDSEELHDKQQKKAEEVLAIAKSGGDFAALARKYSEGPTGPNGGDLGFFSKGQMVPEFDSAVFSLTPGQVSDIVKTSFGYHIIKLDEVQTASTKTLESVKDSIAQTLRMKQAKPLAFQLANQVYEGIIGAGSLSQYGKDNKDLDIVTTDFFAQDAPPPQLKGKNVFLDKAFALAKGEMSSLIETPEGYAIIFAQDIQEPQTPPFETVKNAIEKDFITMRTEDLAKQSAEEVLGALKEGKSLAAVAEEKSLLVKNSGLFSKVKQSDNKDFPSSLATRAFGLTPSKPYLDEAITIGSDYYLMELAERKEPEIAMSDEQRQQYSQALVRLKQERLTSAWIKHQQEDIEVTIHPSLINK